MGPDARRSLATLLVVATSLLLGAPTLAGYARRALFDPNQFADRATATLRDSSVRTLVGERVTDRVVLAHRADLLARSSHRRSRASSGAARSAASSTARRSTRTAPSSSTTRTP